MPDYPQEMLLRLLELQDEDSAIRRLDERRSSLPEAQQLTEVRDRLAELDSDLQIATKQHDEIAREQNRLEGEIELVEGKIAKEEQRMFSGGVSNPKELANLQAEVESLKRKKSTLEDGLLEVMEQKESASVTLTSLQEQHDSADTKAKGLEQAVASSTGDIEAELVAHGAARDSILPDIAPDLLDLYDKLREQKAGVGAAALVGGNCEGCHTKLPNREWERIRQEKGLQRCDNCRRILIVKSA